MIELTKNEELRAAKVAGTMIGKTCMGVAVLLKGIGMAIDNGSGLAAGGLRLAADGIETVGQKTSGFLYEKSDKAKEKGRELIEEKKENNERQEKINALMNELSSVLMEAKEKSNSKISIDPETLLAAFGIKTKDNNNNNINNDMTTAAMVPVV